VFDRGDAPCRCEDGASREVVQPIQECICNA
jgi:hypothetical protein